jgi:diaminopimelate epimerase
MHLTKHEGAGNDFLVVLDPDDSLRLSGDQIRLLCHRHRGIGADGVIRVGRGRGPGGDGGVRGADGADLTMQLHNADGGEAEMSGNGIRCLAQAAVDAGWVTPPTFSVATAGGLRTVTYLPGEEPGWARASVDMGEVTVGPAQEDIDGRTARTADVGNPHLVLVGPGVAGLAGVEIETRGPQLQAAYPEGINVACGTGSVAAAAVARALKLAGGSGPVRVHNPGGMLEVTLGHRADAGASAVLAGPVRKVADIELHPGMLS